MVKATTIKTPSKTAVSSLKSTDVKFGDSFISDPSKALKAKGLVISDAEASRLSREVEKLRARPGGGLAGSAAAETEVTVSVGVKF
ncbi:MULTISPECIES: hypothetical protein [Phyllobacteriaceae]|nr:MULTISPECIES: hypothetical protein [Mesorhizobium]MBN9234273.1 hypothetical protein [Mesorhizobium sp.]MDQ0332338.1 hypothetical protein [Mesorhizobium sp. YL-MeA3-2017]